MTWMHIIGAMILTTCVNNLKEAIIWLARVFRRCRPNTNEFCFWGWFGESRVDLSGILPISKEFISSLVRFHFLIHYWFFFFFLSFFFFFFFFPFSLCVSFLEYSALSSFIPSLFISISSLLSFIVFPFLSFPFPFFPFLSSFSVFLFCLPFLSSFSVFLFCLPYPVLFLSFSFSVPCLFFFFHLTLYLLGENFLCCG